MTKHQPRIVCIGGGTELRRTRLKHFNLYLRCYDERFRGVTNDFGMNLDFFLLNLRQCLVACR
jgi:hypothetical protein